MPESPIEQNEHNAEFAGRDFKMLEIGVALVVTTVGAVVLGGTVLIDKIINHDSLKGVKKEFAMLGSVARAAKNGTPKL